jgi:RNA polymerase sigma-70 factor, ECF subfamily
MKKTKMTNDLQLINAVKNGTSSEANAAITKLYNDNVLVIASFLRRNFTASDVLFQDAVAITFSKALNIKTIKAWNPDFPFSTWLHTIAFNAMIDLLRKEKKSDIVSIEDLTGDDSYNSSRLELTVDNTTGQDLMENDELLDVIKFCIAKLPPSYKELINYNLIDELNDVEISKITGRKPVTIRAHISRGKVRLQELLLERGVSLENL